MQRNRIHRSYAGRVVLVTCALALIHGLTGAAELDAAGVVQAFQAWLDGTRDLEGRFEQTLSSGALGQGLKESGRIYLLRPGRMRWDYLEPERKVALIDGDRTRLYIEEDLQLWEGSLEDAGSLLPGILSHAQPVADLFEATLVATPKVGGKGAYRLRLLPRADAEAFRQVEFVLAPPRFAIQEAEVLDGAGNRMLYRFRDIRRNRGLSPTVFHFEPPPGTEIVKRR